LEGQVSEVPPKKIRKRKPFTSENEDAYKMIGNLAFILLMVICVCILVFVVVKYLLSGLGSVHVNMLP
jgi:hypothetical protein